MDVVEVTGAQSKGGHHANLYSSTNVQPVGTNNAFAQADQLNQHTLGGVGGEGGSAIKLPPGVVFRVAQGSALVIQSHFINATAQPADDRSVLDVKLTPVDPSAQVASLFASVDPAVSLAPNARTTMDFKCSLQMDLHALMYANHMHAYGLSATTELIHDGTTTPLKVDPSWDPSWAFHANYTTFPAASPQLIPAGASLHTTCTWNNTTSKTINFPDEMCIFGVIFLGDKDASCVGASN
jgi:hypothetical protein